MTGVSLETACSSPSRDRNQKPPITARTNTAAIRPVVVRDFNFRGGGGAFSFDLFLDFLLIEITPGESSVADRHCFLPSNRYSSSIHCETGEPLFCAGRNRIFRAAPTASLVCLLPNPLSGRTYFTLPSFPSIAFKITTPPFEVEP